MQFRTFDIHLKSLIFVDLFSQFHRLHHSFSLWNARLKRDTFDKLKKTVITNFRISYSEFLESFIMNLGESVITNFRKKLT